MTRPILALACFLTGCAELEALERQEQAAARANQLSAMREACASYGWASGTPEFANCMQQMDAQEAAAYEQRRAIVLDHYLRNE